jgi:hypothetical protein
MVTDLRDGAVLTITDTGDRDVPVDGFWSITVYNRDGFMEPNDFRSYSLNGVTADADHDGSVTIGLAPTPGEYRNHLYVIDGWNYVIRLYRPRPEVLEGRWTVPAPERQGLHQTGIA